MSETGYIPNRDPTHITDQEFQEELMAFSSHFNLDPSISEAYGHDPDMLYIYPGMDQTFHDTLIDSKRATFIGFSYSHSRAYDNGFHAPEESEYRRQTRRSMQTSRVNMQANGLAMRYLLEGEETRAAIDEVYATQLDGIGRRDLVYNLIVANRASYILETPFQDTPTSDVPEYAPFISFAFGEESRESVTEYQLASKLRDLGVVDLSKDLLDARFEHFSKIIQLEASTLFLSDLQWLALMGGRRQALLLSRRHRQNITADDFDHKMEMMEELTAAFRDVSFRERDPEAKRFLQALSKRAQVTSSSLRSSLEGFRPVYENLGYSLPPELMIPEPEGILKISIQPELPPVEITTPTIEKPLNRTLENEIASQGEAANQQAIALAHEWRLSTKQRRDLRKVQLELTRGFVDFAGRQLLPPMSKDEAQRIVDYLHKVNTIVLSREDAQRALNDHLSRIRSLNEDITLIRVVAKEGNVDFTPPFVEPVEAYLKLFRTEWNTYRQLILKAWPHYEGVTVANRIESLLLGEQAEIHNDSPTNEATALQNQIAEQLDRIVLPPGARKEDLERELRRIGVQNTSIRQIEWQRLSDLADICEQFNGTLFRSKDRSLGNALPYFVVVVELDNNVLAVAESPVFGNATYIVSENQAAGTWLEILELSKADARSVGAHRVVHSKQGGPKNTRHIDRVYDKLLEIASSTGN